MTSRARWLVGFLAALHLLVLLSIWSGWLGRIALLVVLASAIPVVLAMQYLLSRISRPASSLDLWVLLYAAGGVSSIVMYAHPGNPTQAAAYGFGVYNFVLPISCFFAAKMLDRESTRYVIGGMVLLNAFAVGYGLYLYVARPAFYVAFLADRLASQGGTEEWQFFARLQSYLGSTTVGYICAVSLVLLSLAPHRLRRFFPVLVPLFLVGAALSLQRASLLATLLALGYLTFVSRARLVVRVVTLAVIVGSVVYGAIVLQGTLAERVESRLTADLAEGLSRFFAERGYAPGMRYLSRFPLGVGIGGTSSAAANAGLLSQPEVADANFMRIAADLGVHGLLLFVVVLFVATARARRTGDTAAWLTILMITAGIMLSTNILDSYYVSHTFWVLLGVLDRRAQPATGIAGSLDLVSSARAALADRRQVAATALVGLVGAVAFALAQPRLFTARARFTPQEPDLVATGVGGRVDLGTLTTAPSPAEFYAELLRSRALLQPLVTTPLRARVSGDSRPVTFLEAKGIRAEPEARRLELALAELKHDMRVRVVKHSETVDVETRTPDPVLSANLTDSALVFLERFNQGARQARAGAQRRLLEERQRLVLEQLRAAEQRVEAFSARNRSGMRSAPALMADKRRLDRALSVASQGFLQVTQRLEEAKLEEIRAMPLLTIMERPTPPARPDLHGAPAMAIIGAVAGLLMGIASAIARRGLPHRRDAILE